MASTGRHRWDSAARIELLPLLDVVFLLLTFFIYSLAVMVQARLLPVSLTPVSGETATGMVGPLRVLTVTAEGGYALDRDPIADDALDSALAQVAEELSGSGAEAGGGGTLFVALEGSGRVDRGPTLIRLWQRLRAAGIRDVAFVGPPQTSPPETSRAEEVPSQSPGSETLNSPSTDDRHGP